MPMIFVDHSTNLFFQPLLERRKEDSDHQRPNDIGNPGEIRVLRELLQEFGKRVLGQTVTRSHGRHQQRVHKCLSDDESDVKEVMGDDGIHAERHEKERGGWPEPDQAVIVQEYRQKQIADEAADRS